jgi:hypothetical protein
MRWFGVITNMAFAKINFWLELLLQCITSRLASSRSVKL